MTSGVQSQVYVSQAPGIAGDWASGNPRTFYTGGPGGLVTGPSGLTVGLFAWANWGGLADPDSAPIIAANYYGGIPMGAFGFGGAGGAAPTGFVHREQQGLNTTFLLDASQTIPQGFPVALATSGDVWVANAGAAAAYNGMQAFAALSSGAVSFLAAGSSNPTVTCSSTSVTAGTFAGVGSISGNLMTITGYTSGTFVAGGTITVGAATGCQITGQVLPLLSGETLGQVGRYYVSIPEQSVAAGTTISGTYGILTLNATPGGQFQIGAFLTASGYTGGGYVTQYITGNGAANGNTMAVSNNTTFSTTSTTATTAIGTKWFAQSSGAVGEVIKMSSFALG
jgi:hypothetical protein